MSAETPRRAADLMRERAEAAICPCGGPVCNVEQGWFGSAELTVRLDSAGAAEHVAHWSPRTALAAADLLDSVAAVIDSWHSNDDERHLPAAVQRTLTFARTYLAERPQGAGA